MSLIEDEPISTEYSYSYDSKNYMKSESGFVGLGNQGATCYLNSLIQTMYMTPIIRKILYSWKYDEKVHKNAKRSIALQLQTLFAKLQLIEKQFVSTTNLTKSFGWDRSQSFVQHDVNELCRVLLDALDKTFAPNLYQKVNEMKKAKTDEEVEEISKKYDNKIKENNERFVSELYRGEMIDYVLARDFKDENGEEIGRRRKDNYMDIQLVIRGMKSIEDALHNFIKPEVLSDDNQWYCEQLDKKVDAIKGLSFTSFPRILTLNLKRFDYNPITWTREKLGHRVTFPFELDMKPFYNKKVEEGVCTVYDLFSVLIHSGSARMGHYYAYIKDFNTNKWFAFNDENVKEITEKDVQEMYGNDSSGKTSTNAYMLMYRCRNLKDHKITDDMIPEEIRTKITLKNERIKQIKVYSEKKKKFSYVKFCNSNRDFFDSFNAKKTMTANQLLKCVYLRMKKRAAEQNVKFDIPFNCLRMREFVPKYYRRKGRLFSNRGKMTLSELEFSSSENVIVELKEENEKWPDQRQSLILSLYQLYPDNDKFLDYTQIKVYDSYTPLDLRKFIAEMYKNNERFKDNCDWIDENHVKLYLVDKSNTKIIVIPKEDQNKLLEGELGWCNNGDVHVELFREKPRGIEVINKEYFSYEMSYNTPGTKEFENKIVVSKYKTVKELKSILAEKIGLKENEFRIFTYGYQKRDFEDFSIILERTSLYSGSKIFIEMGKPLADYEHICRFYEFTDIEIIEKQEKEERERWYQKNRELRDEMMNENHMMHENHMMSNYPSKFIGPMMSSDEQASVIGHQAMKYLQNVGGKKRRRENFDADSQTKKVKKMEDEENFVPACERHEMEAGIPNERNAAIEGGIILEEENGELQKPEEIELETMSRQEIQIENESELKTSNNEVKESKEEEEEEKKEEVNNEKKEENNEKKEENNLQQEENEEDNITIHEVGCNEKESNEINDKEKESQNQEIKEESDEEKKVETELDLKILAKKMLNEDEDSEFSAYEYHYRMQKQFSNDYFKIMVSEKDTVIEVKKRACIEIMKEKKFEVEPENVRIRSTNYGKLLSILKCDHHVIKEIIPYFDKETKFTYQILEKKELWKEGDYLVKCREWIPKEWKFSSFKEVIVNRKEKKNLKMHICKELDLQENDYYVYLMPQGMDLKKRHVAMIKKEEWENKDFSDKRIYDDCKILFMKKCDFGNEKYDMEKLKKYLKKSELSNFVGGYIKEEALVIKTEFDGKKSEEKNEKEKMEDKEKKD